VGRTRLDEDRAGMRIGGGEQQTAISGPIPDQTRVVIVSAWRSTTQNSDSVSCCPDPVFDRSEVVAEGEPSTRRSAAEDSPHRRSFLLVGTTSRKQMAASTRRPFIIVFAVTSSAFGRAARQAARQVATVELMPTTLSDGRRHPSIAA
jgi:hypothetical protein